MSAQTEMLLSPANSTNADVPLMDVGCGRLLAGLPALSVRQPWATSIVLFGKPIENRDWPEHYRRAQLAKLQASNGWFKIHASKGYTLEEYADWRDFVNSRIPASETAKWPRMTFRDLPRGGIIGVAHFARWVTEHSSPWFIGPGALELDQVQPLPFVPCRGALGFFDPANQQGEPRRVAPLALPPCWAGLGIWNV
jgi:hypothetical protein